MFPHWMATVAKKRLWLYTMIYLSIGLIFIAKYPGRYGLNPLLVGTAYVIFVAVGTLILIRGSVVRPGLTARQLLPIVIVAGVGLLVFMYQFDPNVIRNARFGSLNQSIAALLKGSFPYGEPMSGHHSGFPFWFALALPFYTVGDTGLMQILGYVLGAFILMRIDRPTSAAGIMALVASPAFLYEIAVRSGITTNMILLLIYLYTADQLLAHNKSGPVFILGLIGGLLLSTRGVVFLVLAIYFWFITRRSLHAGLILLAGWLFSFCLTVLPFALWDWPGFLAVGPFTHQLQLTNLNAWLIALSVVLAFIIGRKLNAGEAVFEAAGLFLYLGVCVSFGRSIVTDGFAASVLGSHFDISYFCFPLPFIIVAWMLAIKREIAPEDRQVLR